MTKRDPRGGAATGKRRRNKDGLQAFLQAFPNLSCFCPSFSKENLALLFDFKGLQGRKIKKILLQIFSSRRAPFGHIPDAVGPYCAFEDGRRFASGQ